MLPERRLQLQMSQVMLRGEDLNASVRGGSNQETRSSRSDACCSRPHGCRLKMGVGKALRMGKLGPMTQALVWERGNSTSDLP